MIVEKTMHGVRGRAYTVYSACCVISISDRGLTRGAVRHVGGVVRRSNSGVTVGGGRRDANLYPLYPSVDLVFTFKNTLQYYRNNMISNHPILYPPLHI